MKLILNEKEYAKQIIEKGIIGKKVTQTIRLLAKYYVSLGMNEEQVKSSIESFMGKHYNKFNKVKWENTISDIVHKAAANKRPMLEIKSIHITKSELDTIKTIGNLRLEKVAFVLLVYSKIYNEMNGNKKNWVNCDLKDIFTDAKIALNPKDQAIMIHKLVNLGLAEPSKKVDCTNLKVKFANEKSEVEIEINDFREYVLEYLGFKGERISNCEECGVKIIKSGKNQKMCKNCWNTKEKILRKEINKKYYDKNKY